jgi:transcriptional regulator GlxA family with amidase domain
MLISFVIFDGFQILDLTGPLAVFEVAGRFASGAYDLRIVAEEPGLVRASCGARIAAEGLDIADAAHTVIFAGGDGTRSAMHSGPLRSLANAVVEREARLASVCSGSFILAAAGVLDGLRATTHWQRSADMVRHFPEVRLEPDRIWIRQGRIWTSAGITAGIDLALALVAEDLGEEVARKTARQLVVYHRRSGGQSQFSALADLDPREGRFSRLLEWARANLALPLTVEDLADHAAMSPRNFARAFVSDLGVTPAKAVERLRLEEARARLEGAPDTLERIAAETGFGDPERMRRAFLRVYGQPPQALRRKARAC